MKKQSFALFLLWGVLVSCADPPPRCAPRSQPHYRCGTEDQLWRCPAGAPDVAAHNEATDEACARAMGMDPVVCVLDRDDYKFVDMELAEDCGDAGEVCVEDQMTKNAVCQESM